ncbi:hypothetical protein D9615_001015 [Tricholomella constricta]|uniref:F-box domain-containing protein n=1 Tax=Tricholomella constricta TaxID=117010 RepID=A0A8H5HLC8_9AGAR|nr:hypothetical protein D9615_001015 [Tricholomella constricta]
MAAWLPSELLHLIFKHLDDLPETLQSCALTCHTWYPTSQAHIFHAIFISNKNQCQRLNNHLARWPHIIPHVRRLSLHIPASADHASETQLLRLLTHTDSNIQSLTLHLVWQKLAPDVRDALILVLQRPTLTSLLIHRSFFDMDGDFPNVLSASNLKRLSLLGVLCLRQGIGASTNPNPIQAEDNHPVPRFKTHIQELTISPQYNSSPAITEWLLSPRCTLSLARLQALHITHCDRLNHSLPSGLLKLAGSALTQFSFTTESSSQKNGLQGIDIDFSNPSLRSIAFALPVDILNVTRGFGPPQWIENALATLARSTEHIEKLELTFLVGLPTQRRRGADADRAGAVSSILVPVDNQQWNDSMSAWPRLLSSSRFSALGCVRFVLAYDIALSGESDVRMALVAIKERAEREMRMQLGELKVDFVLEGFQSSYASMHPISQ